MLTRTKVSPARGTKCLALAVFILFPLHPLPARFSVAHSERNSSRLCHGIVTHVCLNQIFIAIMILRVYAAKDRQLTVNSIQVHAIITTIHPKVQLNALSIIRYIYYLSEDIGGKLPQVQGQ